MGTPKRTGVSPMMNVDGVFILEAFWADWTIMQRAFFALSIDGCIEIHIAVAVGQIVIINVDAVIIIVIRWSFVFFRRFICLGGGSVGPTVDETATRCGDNILLWHSGCGYNRCCIRWNGYFGDHFRKVVCDTKLLNIRCNSLDFFEIISEWWIKSQKHIIDHNTIFSTIRLIGVRQRRVCWLYTWMIIIIE